MKTDWWSHFDTKPLNWQAIYKIIRYLLMNKIKRDVRRALHWYTNCVRRAQRCHGILTQVCRLKYSAFVNGFDTCDLTAEISSLTVAVPRSTQSVGHSSLSPPRGCTRQPTLPHFICTFKYDNYYVWFEWFTVFNILPINLNE